MGETTAAGTRCPRCSAAVRPGAPWCTQCYAPLGAPAPAAPPAPAVPQQRPAPSRAVEPTAPALDVPSDLLSGSWPCTACSTPNDLALPACQGCGTPFLAAARAAPPTVVLPGVGDLLALSPVRRVGLALGTVIAFVVVAALLALLLA